MCWASLIVVGESKSNFAGTLSPLAAPDSESPLSEGPLVAPDSE